MNLWRFVTVCRFGTRCAKVEAEPPRAPTGYYLTATYICGNCGRNRRLEVPV